MTTSLIEEQTSLEFKADLFPMTVIKLSSSNLSAIKSQLSATVVAAPNYFKNAPVVIDITSLQPADYGIDLQSVCELLKNQNMRPLGIRCDESLMANFQIPDTLIPMKAKAAKPQNKPSLDNPVTTKVVEKTENSTSNKTKLVNSPIRSGTQIYARNADLVITAAVNAGGECVADGNIHIYGPLRGKALAGANGNEEARIFCSSLEAELIAIAGHYLTSDQIERPKTEKSMIQIYLKDGKIRIDGI